MIVFIDGVLPRQKLVWSANNCLSLSGLLEVAQNIPLVATSKKCALSDATHPYDDKTMARDVVTPPTHKVAPKGVWLGFSLRDLAVKICPDGAAVATKPLIVYYTASWCGNCKRFYPIIIELGKRLSDKVSLAILEDDPTNYSAIQRDFMMPRVPKNVFPRLMLYRQGDNGAGEAFEGVICNPSIVVAEMSLQPGTSLDTLIKQLDDLIV
jgi:thiol-disulfide isomerase/thioredoxin